MLGRLADLRDTQNFRIETESPNAQSIFRDAMDATSVLHADHPSMAAFGQPRAGGGAVGPGMGNDPDMPVDGRPGLSLTEPGSHFALWALMDAPLMAGNDIRALSADGVAILRNPRLPAVHQDSLGAGGRRVRDDGSSEVFTKPLPDGSVAVGLFTRGREP